MMGNATMAGANATAQGFANAGNALAAGRIGAVNAIQGGIGNALGMWQQNEMMNAFAPKVGAGSFANAFAGSGGLY